MANYTGFWLFVPAVITGKVGDHRVRFVKFDGVAEFMTESAVQVYRDWKLDFSVNCPTHHWQTGPVERGHSIHQNSLRTMGSFVTLRHFCREKKFFCQLKFKISSFMQDLMLVLILI